MKKPMMFLIDENLLRMTLNLVANSTPKFATVGESNLVYTKLSQLYAIPAEVIEKFMNSVQQGEPIQPVVVPADEAPPPVPNEQGEQNNDDISGTV